MDFTDFLFPNNMQKYRFPVYFNYRDMICTFINLNESMGTMLFSLSYDSSVPEDKRDVYSALDCVQRDDIFDYNRVIDAIKILTYVSGPFELQCIREGAVVDIILIKMLQSAKKL